MARILIGWEFGGNRGHAVKMAYAARALVERGHEVALALQQVDSIPRAETDALNAAVWQAPVSPRLLINSGRRHGGATASHADTLAKLGLDDPELTAGMIRAWRRIFSAVKPDLVCAEFAPLLLLAARGALPAVATGTGFDLPPATLASFPSLTGRPPALDEAATLDSVNRALSAVDIAPLQTLPEVYAASEAVVGAFREFDPYRDVCDRPLVSPFVPLPIAEAGDGEEVFVYGVAQIEPDAPLWAGLAESGLPVRLFVPNLSASYRQALRGRGFIVEEAPVPFPQIAERSRVLVSHGGHGFVCSGLLAGIPQVICPHDLEKALTAAAVTRLGVGGAAPLRGIKPEPFAASLKQIHGRSDLADRARAAAADFRQRAAKPFHLSLVEAIERAA